jgi:uncharacterized protein (PEP-CTERM system associated)
MSPEVQIGRVAGVTLCALVLAIQGASAQVYPAPGTPAPSAIGGRATTDISAPLTPRPGLRFESSIAIEETLTSNANFDRGNTTDRRSDFVTQITPGFRIDANGAHTSLSGAVFVPVYLYARTGGDNDRVLPDVHLVGTFDALDRRFFLEAGADVHREFLSPFGGQPISPVTNSQNEYMAQSYRITPAFRGELPGYVRYELSDLNLWTRATNAPSALDNAYSNELKANLSRAPQPFGWGVDYDLVRTLFVNSPSQKTEITRLRASVAPDPGLQLAAIVGYEDNDYAGLRFNNAVYGAGVTWHPSERTSLDATAEHRFFGTGYRVAFEHRTALSVWELHASRDISSYPQQLLALAGGSEVNTLLNALFASRIPDPQQRQQAIDTIVRTYALPAVLPGAVALYSQNVTLVTEGRAVVGLLGARNNVYLSVFRLRNQSLLSLAADIPNFLPSNDYTQTGANVTWSNRLSPTMTLSTQLNASHTTGNLVGGDTRARTNNGSVIVSLSTPLSQLTDFYAGARYQLLRSNLQNDAEEAAIFVGILHRFH